MIRLVPAAFAILVLAAAPALAAADDAPQILTNRVIAGLSLDDLFARLKENAGLPAGQRIEQEILRRFSESGSPTADLLMSWAVTAMEDKNFPLALDVLDQVILVKPDFAEAWNKRATVYFMTDNYGASLSDIRATLALEPRHFGALTGLGTILQAMDRKTEAIRVFERALEIDPQLDKVRESLEALKKETEGPSI
jgi:tetratricopeptide (TPR) repeat protein